MNDKLFDENVINESNNLRKAYKNGYNVAYTYGEIEELYNAIAEEMRIELATEQNIDIASKEGLNSLKTVYDRVAERYKDDVEIYNKLQYIYDTRVDSYAGYYTNKDGVESASSVGKYPYSGDNSDNYIMQQYVNLGLVKRDKTDLSLIEDLAEVIVSTNGKDTVFSHNENNSVYKQELDRVDYGSDEEDVELYVRYKLTVKNSTKTETNLKEVVDYYRNIYSFTDSDSYKTKEGNTIARIEAKKISADGTETSIEDFRVNSSNYIEASRIGLEGIKSDEEKGYDALYITFADGEESKLGEGDRLEIYVTLKLGNGEKTGKQMLEEYAQGDDELSENNYAEINGYKTNAGVLDANSKPGTFKVKEYEEAKAEYISAYVGRNSEKIRFKNALNNLNRIRENDAWGIETSYTRYGYAPTIKIKQRVSNMKVYLQDGTLQLNANIDENGNVEYLNDKRYTNIVRLLGPTNAYKDGYIETLLDDELLTGATVEITYAITATAEGNSKSSVKANIDDLVDYIDLGMNFTGINKAGERINDNWEIASFDSFNSTRKNNEEILPVSTIIVRAKKNNPILDEMKAGEERTTAITLSKTLSSNKIGTNDIAFSNLAEIVAVSNKNTVMQGYDITGKERTETSFEISKDESIDNDNIYLTLGTAKSETVVFHAPEGQNRIERILSNTIIAIVSLSILVGGIVLIKKFVIINR